jgi:molybdopterin synthase catalytic subunit
MPIIGLIPFFKLNAEPPMIHLTRQPIDTAELLRRVSSPLAGAVVLFLGTVREVTGDRRTTSLDYECYPEMATGKLAELEAEARCRWEIVECAIVHRLGHLELEEVSVAVAVSTAHRQTAFEAGKWLIDTLKEVVPIWKKENWADGTSQWIHPGVEGTPRDVGT